MFEGKIGAFVLPQEETEDEKENKSMKRMLQPLGTLPLLHPLLRESSSDEGYASLHVTNL